MFFSSKSSTPVVSPTLNQIDPCILKLNNNIEDIDYTKTVREFLEDCILESKFDINLILGQSEDPTCDGPCKCVPHQDCNWSKKMINVLLKLSKNNLAYKTGFRFYKNRVCDISKRHVYCCNGDQHPSEEQVKKLKVTEPCIPTLITPGGPQDIHHENGPNGLNWQCCLADSSRTDPTILIFSIAMDANYSFELISFVN